MVRLTEEPLGEANMCAVENNLVISELACIMVLASRETPLPSRRRQCIKMDKTPAS